MVKKKNEEIKTEIKEQLDTARLTDPLADLQVSQPGYDVLLDTSVEREVIPLTAGDKLKRGFRKTKNAIGKHSPTILGIAALGFAIGGGVLAYRAGRKIQVYLEEVEASDVEIPKSEIQKNIAKIAAPPVVLFTASVVSQITSLGLFNKRMNRLRMLSDELLAAFKEAQEGERSRESTIAGNLVVDRNSLIGEWAHNAVASLVSDDQDYNDEWVKTCDRILYERLHKVGMITLNEVRDELGFAKIPEGNSLGWYDTQSFQIHNRHVRSAEGTHCSFVTWGVPNLLDTIV